MKIRMSLGTLATYYFIFLVAIVGPYLTPCGLSIAPSNSVFTLGPAANTIALPGFPPPAGRFWRAKMGRGIFGPAKMGRDKNKKMRNN